MTMPKSVPDEAWEPTLQEFVELVALAARDKLRCSHRCYGMWSFWKPLGPSVVLCSRTGRVYSVTADGRPHWVTREEALTDLGVELEGGMSDG